jgi:hypothetical protein
MDHAQITRAQFDAKNLKNAAIVATQNFEANISATPIGMLNLERLEMKPAGIERGGLIATIPLAPKERTSVIHKEWSVTTKEFTSIVTDSLENYSETGVTDNTELSQSTTNQIQHSDQFNANATVSGSIPLITSAQSSAGFTVQDQDSKSAAESRKHSVAMTRKASSRVKQEHKVTISSTTSTGTSETSTRVIENPSTTSPMRVDYFSMMRKWRVGLYRYGLRLTYDIAIPEPGATMRKQIAELTDLHQQAAQGFVFPLKPSDITEGSAASLADQFKVNIPQYPGAIAPLRPNVSFKPGTDKWYFTDLSFDVTEGYMIEKILLHTQIADEPKTNIDFGVMGTTFARGGVVGPLIIGQDPSHPLAQEIFDEGGAYFLAGGKGHQTVTFFMHYTSDSDPCWIGLTVNMLPTPEAIDQWRSNVWNAIYNSAQTAFFANEQVINARIQALQDQINNVDTLTLRREENEEIMKGVLRWLLGPSFDFMPPEVIEIFLSLVPITIPSPGGSSIHLGQEGTDLVHGIAFTGNELGINAGSWATVRRLLRWQATARVGAACRSTAALGCTPASPGSLSGAHLCQIKNPLECGKTGRSHRRHFATDANGRGLRSERSAVRVLTHQTLQRVPVQHGGRLEPVLLLEPPDCGLCLGSDAPVYHTVIKTFRLQLLLGGLYRIRGEFWRLGLIGGRSYHRLLHP